MAKGPGRYDDIAKFVMQETGALGVVLVIVGGSRGHGSCVNVVPEMRHTIPMMLRDLADMVTADLGEENSSNGKVN